MKDYQLEILLKNSLETETVRDLLTSIIDELDKEKVEEITDVYISTLNYEDEDFTINHNNQTLLLVEDNYINDYPCDYYLESENGFIELFNLVNNLFFNPKTCITYIQYKN